MSWASGKRLIIVAAVALVVIVAVTIIAALALNKTPSCMDGLQNEDEAGIDCGGSCAYLCQAEVAEPSVVYARAVRTQGRTDVVAYVENRNAGAEVKDARYTVEVYDANRTVLAAFEGRMDLPRGLGVPVYIPDIYRGEGAVGQASLVFADDSLNWVRSEREYAPPRAGEIRVEGTPEAPRIVATMFNASVIPLQEVTLVLAAYDASGIVIAASKTILPRIEGEGTATATFTWNEPFAAEPVRIDIRPITRLP